MRTKTGTVSSNKMKNTIVIKVVEYKQHPKYKKRFQVSRKFYAHDPGNTYQIGDTVTIYECRPLSRLKRWTVISPELEKVPSQPNL